jgi:hypothetical protein
MNCEAGILLRQVGLQQRRKLHRRHVAADEFALDEPVGAQVLPDQRRGLAAEVEPDRDRHAGIDLERRSLTCTSRRNCG